MVKKNTSTEIEKPSPKKVLSAQDLLSEFLRENKIILDYEIVPSRIVDVGDGLVVVPSRAPVIKVKASYEQ